MLSAAGAGLGHTAEHGWISLLPGKSLKGWRTEGNAAWSMEDGVLVGRPGPGSAAGDIFTVKQWADFDLESEWKMRWPGNSGIWFRVNGKDTGYQADILDVPIALSGSLYCMGKDFLFANHDKSTVKMDDWNLTRIKAVGDDILVEQNGRKMGEVHDHTWPGAGSIGVQVHTGAEFANMEIRVRSLRLKPLKRPA
jgi:hypothetical protein